MEIREANICFVGNMLGRNPGYVTTQGQIVADLLSAEGFSVTCVSSKLNRGLRLCEIVMALVKGRRKFDVLVAEVYSGLGLLVADVAGRLGSLFGIPTVMFLHGGHLPDFVKAHPRWAKSVLDRAHSIVAPSRFLAEQIGTFGYEIAQIPNVVDIADYSFRERSHIQPNLIWMRSFHSIYNPEMAVRVLSAVLSTFPKATLTMAGVDKGMEDTVKQMAEDLDVSHAVRFPGFLDLQRKQKEFAAADIYLNTNRIDNMPVSVLEACAFGLPVVATRVGGLPYLIDDEENGLLVPNEDVTEMVKAIERLLGDPELTRRISAGGRRLAERSSWDRVRGEWERLLGNVLRTASAAPAKIAINESFSADG